MQYQIALDAQEINLIMQALGELPLRSTINVFTKIDLQVRQQNVRVAPSESNSED